ncbi:capsid cement protein [uncultured Sphingobium sp.]|uniref:capsid cement protein n=1 Tax=uncultured Sphingobium sp. TaxID=316087 RepID=UPI00259BB375|nr:capsid cement protein [uncultured Sphingobium sp.]
MSQVAAAAVSAARFVGLMTGLQCASGAKALGVTQYAAAVGEAFAVDVHGTTIVEAGGAIAAGAEVKAAADGSGRAIERGGAGPLDGYAVTAAAAAGQKIEILLKL